VTPSGGIHVTWAECVTRDVFGNCILFRLMYSSSLGGSIFSATEKVAENTFMPGVYDMAGDGVGNVSIAYATSGFSGSTIVHARVEGGHLVRTSDVSRTPANQYAVHAEVAIDPAGRLWLAWSENAPPRPSNIFATMSADGGQSFGPRINVSKSDARPAGVPVIAFDLSGLPWIAWGQRSPDSSYIRPMPAE